MEYLLGLIQSTLTSIKLILKWSWININELLAAVVSAGVLQQVNCMALIYLGTIHKLYSNVKYIIGPSFLTKEFHDESIVYIVYQCTHTGEVFI